MFKSFDFPDWFKDKMDRTAKAKRLSIDKEMVQIFWDYIKKYSTDRAIVEKATDEMVEHGEYFDPGNIIKYIPRQYPNEKGWPTLDEVAKANKSGIARDCLALVKQMMTGDVDSEKFRVEVTKLKQKYPEAF